MKYTRIAIVPLNAGQQSKEKRDAGPSLCQLVKPHTEEKKCKSLV